MKKKRCFLILLSICLLFLSIPVSAQESLLVKNEEFVAEQPWYIKDIQAESLWKALDQKLIDREIIVAVIDTGVDYTHEMLAKGLWINEAEKNGVEGVDDDENGYVDDIYGINTSENTSDPMDDSIGTYEGHGTHIAGTILQTANVTAAENPYQIKVMAVKAGNRNGYFRQSSLIEAVNYAVEMGADIINLSLGLVNISDGFTKCLETASKRCLIVAAAGNQGVSTKEDDIITGENYYPAAFPYVLGVMAYNSNHMLADFSNWDAAAGSDYEYEIAAPGVDIVSVIPGMDAFTMTGTSMAAGVVSGSAALLMQNNSPETTDEEIRRQLLGAAIYDVKKNYGLLVPQTFWRINLASFEPEEVMEELPSTETEESSEYEDDIPAEDTKPLVQQSNETKQTTPEIISITKKGSGIHLKWTASNESKGYVIYRKKGANGSYKKYKSISAGKTSYTDTNIAKGTYYYYRIRSLGSKSTYHSSLSPVKKVIVLQKISNFSVKQKKNKLVLSWKRDTKADGYEIYRTTLTGKSRKRIAVISTNKRTSLTRTKRYLKQSCIYQIRAYKIINGKKVYSAYSSRRWNGESKK